MVTFQIGLKKFLLLKNVKNAALWTNVIRDLNSEEIVRRKKRITKNESKKI